MTELDLSKNVESLFTKEQITDSVLRLSQTLNGNTEYYIAGGLAAFILSNSELDREFSDIDIMIPETEIDNAKSALMAADYKFWDERLTHRKREDLIGLGGHHEYGAKDSQTGVRIGIFTFDCLDGGKIILRQHFGEKNDNGQLVDKIYEATLPNEILKDDLFSAEPVNFMGRDVFTITPEHIYIRKMNGSRQKDITDFEKISPIINTDKLTRLRKNVLKIETKIF